jgi:hypothetical protein
MTDDETLTIEGGGSLAKNRSPIVPPRLKKVDAVARKTFSEVGMCGLAALQAFGSALP